MFRVADKFVDEFKFLLLICNKTYITTLNFFELLIDFYYFNETEKIPI